MRTSNQGGETDILSSLSVVESYGDTPAQTERIDSNSKKLFEDREGKGTDHNTKKQTEGR